MPGFPADLLEDLERACRAALDLTYRLALRGAPDGVAVQGVEGDADIVRVAAAFVELGLGLDVMTRIVRFAHQEAVGAAPGDAEGARDGTARQTVGDVARVSAETWARVETMIGALASAYADEQRRRGKSGVAARAAALETVLDGSTIDRSRVERDLGYELDGTHTAFLVWDPSGAVDPNARYAAAREHAQALGGTDLLCVGHGTSAMRCWTHGNGTTRDVEDDPVRAPLAIATGGAHEGPEGFRRSHAEALKTQNLMAAAGPSFGSAVAFTDVALLVLLSSDLPAAERFVASRLGPLVAPDRNTRTLLETLEVYFAEGCSHTRSAARLDTHVKTIAYRVRRIEMLLGHPVDQRMLDTQAALALRRWLDLRRDQVDEAEPPA